MKIAARWVAVGVWCALIFILSGIPDLRVTEEPTWDLILRKLAHMAVYAVLVLLVYHATRDTWFKGGRDPEAPAWPAGQALAFACLYAISDEFHQAVVPTRNGSPVDVAIDWVGACLIWWWLTRGVDRLGRVSPPKPAQGEPVASLGQ